MTIEGPPRLGDLRDGRRGRSWTDYGVTELIDHLVGTHHAYLVTEFPRLLDLGEQLLAAEAEAFPELPAVLDRLDRLNEELGPHLLTEEEVLFPWCRRLEAGEPVDDWVTARVHCMHRQHVDTEALLDDLRRLTDNFAVPAGASPEHRAFITGMAAFDADTRLHIHKEEDVLFPAVTRASRQGECQDPPGQAGGLPEAPRVMSSSEAS